MSERAELEVVLQSVKATLEAKRLEKQLHQIGDAADMASRRGAAGMRSFGSSLGYLKAALAGLGIGVFLKEALEAGMRMEAASNTIRTLSGSVAIAGGEIRFLRAEAERLGQSFSGLLQPYISFLAATNQTTLQGEKAKDVFFAVAEAATVLGLSANTTEGAMLALQQMVSKGTVMAEELRGQLGERLPGAFQIAARAMGMTTSTLSKMLEQGKIVSADFLPKFATELRKTFGEGVALAADSTQANLNRVKNAWYDLLVAVAQSGLLQAVVDLIKGMKELFMVVGDAMGAFDAGTAAMDTWRFSANAVIEVTRSLVVLFHDTYKTMQQLGQVAMLVGDVLKAEFGLVWEVVKTVFGNFKRAIMDVVDGLIGMVKTVRDVFSFLATSVTGSVDETNKALQAVITSQASFTALMSGLTAVPTDGLAGLAGHFDKAALEIATSWEKRMGEIRKTNAEILNFSNVMGGGGNDNPTAGVNKKSSPIGPLMPNADASLALRFDTKQMEAMRDLKQMLAEVATQSLDGTEQMRVANEQWFSEQIDQFDKLAEKAGITAETYEYGMLKIRRAYDKNLSRIPDTFAKSWDLALTKFGTFTERFASLGESLANTLDKSITDGLMEMIEGTKSASQAFADMGRAIVQEMVRIAIQQLVVRTLLRSIGGGVAHSGGVIGETALAKRLHTGGVADRNGVVGDEVPVIARRGEVYFTPEQIKALGSAVNGGRSDQGGKKVEIYNGVDETALTEHLMRNPDIIVNIIGRRRSTVRQMLA